MLENKIRVPYIDEDLELSDDKTELSYCGCFTCKKTGCQTLNDYGECYCAECGDHIDEEDAIEFDGEYYCENCAMYCHCCDDWFPPDADGARDCNGEWVCESCLGDHYGYCDECEEYYPDDDIHSVYDKDGNEISVCSECRDKYYSQCTECGEFWADDALKDEGEKTLCPNCLDKKEA